MCLILLYKCYVHRLFHTKSCKWISWVIFLPTFWTCPWNVLSYRFTCCLRKISQIEKSVVFSPLILILYYGCVGSLTDCTFSVSYGSWSLPHLLDLVSTWRSSSYLKISGQVLTTVAEDFELYEIITDFVYRWSLRMRGSDSLDVLLQVSSW